MSCSPSGEVSAFAMYSKKRKSTDSKTPEIKLKKKKSPSNNSSPTISIKTPLSTKKTKKHCKSKKSLNTSHSSPNNFTGIHDNSVNDTSNNTTIDTDNILNDTNPKIESENLFRWLIDPKSPKEFFRENWESMPLCIRRSNKHYYSALMSSKVIDDILKNNNILYTKNLDITSYANGQRETHNPPGRAHSAIVWDYYANGCSVRMLDPQTYIPEMNTLNSTLQEYFGCFVGTNFYLTPPGNQGFAPHYDDIEAFALQIEGKKRWRLYKPRNENELMPRYSSQNFNQTDLGEIILDTILNAGDILYFPRGTVHQAETLEDSHSLHVTLSVYQKNSWSDFLEKLLPNALQTAIFNNYQLRRGLPINYLNSIGLAHKDKSTESRKKFKEITKTMLKEVIDAIDVDWTADQMVKSQMHEYLPPVLSPVEFKCSVLGSGDRMVEEGKVTNMVEIEPDTKIRLTRAHCVRLIEDKDDDDTSDREDDTDNHNTYKLYYSCDNTDDHKLNCQYLEIAEHIVPAIKKIIQVYPEFIKVDDLPIDDEDERVQVARDLWDKCIVLTEQPLLEMQ